MRIAKNRRRQRVRGLWLGLASAWGLAWPAAAQSGSGSGSGIGIGMLAASDPASGTIILESQEVLHVTPSSRMRSAQGVWIGLEAFPVPREGEPIVVYYQARDQSGKLEVVNLELGSEVPQ